MIHWFDEPFRGNSDDGFEVIIHGLVFLDLGGTPKLHGLLIDEDGQLAPVPFNKFITNFRYDRKNQTWLVAQLAETD